MPKNEIVSPEGVVVVSTDSIEALRDHLLEAYDKHRARMITDQEAAATAMLGGRIISTLALECKYHQQRKEKPDIKFLNVKEEN